MSTEMHNPHNRRDESFDSPGRHLGAPSAHWQVCEWLRANGINPNHIPADPCASIADGQITLLTKVQGPNGGDMIAPQGDEILKETKTFPLRVPPSPLVEIWLAPKCPTCGR